MVVVVLCVAGFVVAAVLCEAVTAVLCEAGVCDNPSPDVRIGARIDCALGKLSLIDGSRMSP